MTFNPLAATGLLTAQEDGPAEITGTCFLFRHDTIALTAAHCIPQNGVNLAAHFPLLGRTDSVTEVRRHPNADIAVLFLGKQPDQYPPRPEHAFWDRVSNWHLGEDFIAYGYPSEGPSFTSENGPTPRLFKGYYQRFFHHNAPQGGQYLAGEMSIPAPGGLSGGPIFRPGAHTMLTGIVTANNDSYAITDSIEEVTDEGKIFRLESRRVITYGTALMLSGVTDWLRGEVPSGGGSGAGWIS